MPRRVLTSTTSFLLLPNNVGLISSSIVLNISSTNILIDCCEGAQFQLRKNKIKLSKIEIILISHAHGDHYFGLIGLIST